VEKIFKEGFNRRGVTDKVVFEWQRVEKIPGKELGWKETNFFGFYPKEVWIGLHSDLQYGARGQTGTWVSGINPIAIEQDMQTTQQRCYPVDRDIAVANTIAHEIGLHVIAGDELHGRSGTGELEVDRAITTYEQQGTLGHFSADVLDEIIDELDLEVPPSPIIWPFYYDPNPWPQAQDYNKPI
jgi:hypothetical protein